MWKPGMSSRGKGRGLPEAGLGGPGRPVPRPALLCPAPLRASAELLGCPHHNLKTSGLDGFQGFLAESKMREPLEEASAPVASLNVKCTDERVCSYGCRLSRPQVLLPAQSLGGICS